MTIPSVDQQVTFIYAHDLERTAAFYGPVLGLEQVLDQGACRIFRVAGEAFLGICSKGKRSPEPGGVIVTLVTAEVDAWYEWLKARDVPLDGPPAVNEAYGIYNFFAHDPNGYLVEFQRFLDPAWPSPGRHRAD